MFAHVILLLYWLMRKTKLAHLHHEVHIPALSAGGRHMMIMSNLGTLVKFSRCLTAISVSSLSQFNTKNMCRLEMIASNISKETVHDTNTYLKKVAIHWTISRSKGAVKAFLKIWGNLSG